MKDLFISHAYEDKVDFVRPLVYELDIQGYEIWYDEYELLPGDSLTSEIDRGLTEARAGLVILSKQFFNKKWPQRELGGLVARANNDSTRIIPISYQIEISEICEKSPTLADLKIIHGSKPIPDIVDDIATVILPDKLDGDVTVHEMEDHFSNGYYEAAVSSALRFLQTKLKNYALDRLGVRYFKKRPLGSYSVISLIDLLKGKNLIVFSSGIGAGIDWERLSALAGASFRRENFSRVTARWIIDESLKLVRINKIK